MCQCVIIEHVLNVAIIQFQIEKLAYYACMHGHRCKSFVPLEEL